MSSSTALHYGARFHESFCGLASTVLAAPERVRSYFITN
ncbi:hypothetical protein PI126_g24124 [Phytophthora idaei]|nr:hypothetical protein PI126_g24124 [Phytophthora idaei]